MNVLGVTIGNTDGGVLDFLIFGVMQGSYTKWWLVIIVGIVWFVIYYFVFKTVILKFDLKTPGRTVDKNESNSETDNSAHGDNVDDEKLKELGALGVVHLDKQNVQIIIGTRVTTVRKQLDAII